MTLDWFRKRKVLLSVLGVVALALAGVARLTRKQWVEVGQVRRGPIIEAVYGLATVVAEHRFQVKVGVTANIRRLYVREGDEVRAGVPLLELDSGSVFRAPFPGTVTFLPFKEGESIFAQLPILTLVDLRNLYLLVSLEQQGALRVKPGLPAVFTFESMRDQRFQGIVRAIYSNEGQFLVDIRSQTLPPQVLPGMTADVAIQIGRREEALVVPVTAVSQDRITVRRGGKVLEVPLKLGVRDGDSAQVLEGDLNPGDRALVPEGSAVAKSLGKS